MFRKCMLMVPPVKDTRLDKETEIHAWSLRQECGSDDCVGCIGILVRYLFIWPTRSNPGLGSESSTVLTTELLRNSTPFFKYNNIISGKSCFLVSFLFATLHSSRDLRFLARDQTQALAVAALSPTTAPPGNPLPHPLSLLSQTSWNSCSALTSPSTPLSLSSVTFLLPPSMYWSHSCKGYPINSQWPLPRPHLT